MGIGKQQETAGRKRAEKTDTELKQLAIELAAGNLYSTLNVKQEDWAMVFFPMAMAVPQMSEETRREIDVVYAVFGKHRDAGRFVNGSPMFFECEYLTKEETARFREFHKKLEAL